MPILKNNEKYAVWWTGWTECVLELPGCMYYSERQ